MLGEECTTDAIPSPPRNKKFSPKDDKKRKPKVLESDDDEEYEDKFKNEHEEQLKKDRHPVNQSVVYINNATNVHLGNNIFIEHKKPQQTSRRRVEETEKIKSLKNSSKAVTPEDIGVISQYVSTDWQDTARALGYTDPEIDQFIYSHPKNLKQTVYDFLRDWIQNQGPLKATVGLLAQTLWKCQQREAVEKWSEHCYTK